MSTKMSSVSHSFGGDWTLTKLQILSKYLKAYNVALDGKPSLDRPFRRAFIDAFAGTGYRSVGADLPEDTFRPSIPELEIVDTVRLLDGSARMALMVEPRFDKYIFIEKNRDRCNELSALRTEFPDRAASIQIYEGDANEEIQKLCRANWAHHRAVMFLDPYGLQVDWKTIEAIAATKAIDLWILFPLGIGVNRMLVRDGNIPLAWRRRLDTLLGTTEWFDEFYKLETRNDLLGTDITQITKQGIDCIGQFFINRLSQIFPGVSRNPAILRNSTNCPMYMFCFAVANPNGVKPAMKIAGDLLKKVERNGTRK